MILAPNHPSLLDAVLIMACVPNVTCVMKASLMGNPFLRSGARFAGFIRNDAPRNLIHQASEALRRGSHLLIFPEGTRTAADADRVDPFKGGVALISSITGLPVQPVYITSNSPYLGKGWPLLRRPRFPLAFSVSLGRPLAIAPGETLRDFLHRAELQYRSDLKARGV